MTVNLYSISHCLATIPQVRQAPWRFVDKLYDIPIKTYPAPVVYACPPAGVGRFGDRCARLCAARRRDSLSVVAGRRMAATTFSAHPAVAGPVRPRLDAGWRQILATNLLKNTSFKDVCMKVPVGCPPGLELGPQCTDAWRLVASGGSAMHYCRANRMHCNGAPAGRGSCWLSGTGHWINWVKKSKKR